MYSGSDVKTTSAQQFPPIPSTQGQTPTFPHEYARKLSFLIDSHSAWAIREQVTG